MLRFYDSDLISLRSANMVRLCMNLLVNNIFRPLDPVHNRGLMFSLDTFWTTFPEIFTSKPMSYHYIEDGIGLATLYL